MTEPTRDLHPHDAAEMAQAFVDAHREMTVAVHTAREGIARAQVVADAAGEGRRAGARRGWGWRRAVRFAVERRMYTPDYLTLYARFLAHRLCRRGFEPQGMVFFGRGVGLDVRRGQGRIVIGPWSWIGSHTRLRSHEGNLRLGAKVVFGTANVVNSYLDVEIGRDALLADNIYICDFDHRYDDVTVPIRKQGIVKRPVRIGEDVWIGEKVSVLRGADIGSGSVIGSHSVVRDEIPPFSIAVGAPARPVRSRLPKGMTAEEALDLQRRGRPIPGDALDG